MEFFSSGTTEKKELDEGGGEWGKGGHVRLQGKTDDQSLSNNNNRNRVRDNIFKKLFRLDIFLSVFNGEEKNRTANKIEKKTTTER